uniref:Pantothenate kinase n=1 Tax=Candidatus Aschnera chinzeii TaxID=1485666 RepID=A0AAT9G422_9ENTR|nr:MAG: type I pantothenate kinase [Candidatus Aschnera chinzeii]
MINVFGVKIDKNLFPLFKLLILYINSFFLKQNISYTLLGIKKQKIPYVIGITGSVSAGKTTTAKLLQLLLTNYFRCYKINIIATDGFLYPNKTLIKYGIMAKKGFPQSYNLKNLLQLLYDIKSGVDTLCIPIYSHILYDIIPDKQQIIKNPDILIIEGLNILQNNLLNVCKQIHTSGFIDFSIYIDAHENLLKLWYVDRFLKFCRQSIYNSSSYFHRYSKLETTELINIAQYIWNTINMVNLYNNILPTKNMASLIITKGINHTIINMQLKK